MSGGIEEMYYDEEIQDREAPKWERTTSLVIDDMKKREAFGLQKYGKYLSINTDEDMLQHLYEELLDGAVYIKTLIEQRKIRAIKSYGGGC